MPAARPPPAPPSLPLTSDASVYVTGPATVTVSRGRGWTGGWHVAAGGSVDVPPGVVATFEPAPLHADDVPRSTDADVRCVSVIPPDAACTAPPPRASLPLPPAWRAAAASFAAAVTAAADAGTRPPCVVIVGPKGAGKSTLVRLLANEALSAAAAHAATHPHSGRPAAIVWLDGDCGQPEFTPPGLVSGHTLTRPVVGLPVSHARSPSAAFFVGVPSPGPCPARYAACVAALAAWHAREGEPGAAATVVNTHGWVRGAGLDATTALLTPLAPTHVLVLASPNPRRNAPPVPWWGLREPGGGTAPPAVATLAALEGGASLAPDDSADPRASTWLPFARAAAGMPPASTAPLAASLAEAAAALVATRPRLAPLDALPLVFVGGGVDQPPSGQALRVVNCGVVALAAGREGRGGSHPARVVGLAIVRSVDAARGPAGTLHLLTPVPEADLRHVTELQVGALELPPALLAGGGGIAASPYLAPWCLTAARGSGGRAARSRNDLPRAGQQAR